MIPADLIFRPNHVLPLARLRITSCATDSAGLLRRKKHWRSLKQRAKPVRCTPCFMKRTTYACRRSAFATVVRIAAAFWDLTTVGLYRCSLKVITWHTLPTGRCVRGVVNAKPFAPSKPCQCRTKRRFSTGQNALAADNAFHVARRISSGSNTRNESSNCL